MIPLAKRLAADIPFPELTWPGILIRLPSRRTSPWNPFAGRRRRNHRKSWLAALRFIALLVALAVAVAATSPAQLAGAPPTYAERRAALRELIPDGILILFGNNEATGSEAYRAFHQESNFYYLTGYAEPGAILLVAPGEPNSRGTSDGSHLPPEILFLPERRPAEEVWRGPQPDPEAAETATALGFDRVMNAGAFEEQLKRYGERYTTVYTRLPQRPSSREGSREEDTVLQARSGRIRRAIRSVEFENVRGILAGLRETKTAPELRLIRRAVDCTVEAHRAAAREVRPGKGEYEIGALLKYEMERRGCTITGFDPIVGSGIRSTILHYNKNAERMRAGDLVVLDVGSEAGDYSSDITRTLPVSGRFSPRQREIYEIVLGAQKAVMAAVRPGAVLRGRKEGSLFRIAYDYLNSHGKDANGEPLGQYFRHGVGHGVGLDVHDAINSDGILKEGMVLAIEPGLYLPEEEIGVRIEDMVLVTKDGAELMTGALPREADEIEQLMSGRD